MRKYLGIMKNVQKSCSKQKLQKEPIFVVGGGVKDFIVKPVAVKNTVINLS
jgi:hypothetical protein